MKKLNINEEYVDSNITLYSVSDKYTTLTVWQNEKMRDNIKLYIGDNDLSLTQANAILSIMGLQYELVDETDWSKVIVGSDVTWTEVQKVYKAPDGILRRLGSFHSYVPSLNKVIVICGNEIKAVDASEVELCN